MSLKSTGMRFGAGVAAFILACLAPMHPAAFAESNTLDSLLARVRAASGSAYAAHIVSNAHADEDNRTYELRAESEGDRWLVRRCREALCEGEYFDGSRLFAVSLNDTALPNTLHRDDQERLIHSIANCAFASPGFRASGGIVTDSGKVVRDGKPYRRLVIKSGDAVLAVLIDEATNLPAVAISADGLSAFEFRDFRKVDDVTIPFEVWSGGELIEKFSSRRKAAEPLETPRGLVPAFSANAAPVKMVGLGRERGTEPVIPCTLGGIAVNCLLDTGNSGLGISLELSEQLKLEPTGEYEVSGLGHYLTGIVTTGPLVTAGVTLPSAHYVVLHDLHDYGYDVVLGADFFARARVTLDYPHRTVSVAPATAPSDQATIPLRFDGFMPVVGTQLGGLDAPLAIDTGDEAAVNVSYGFFKNHPGLFEPRGTRTVSGIGGSAEQVIGTIDSVRIATFEVLHQPIAATRAREAAAGGHLGSTFLTNFTVTLDYPNARLGLVPRPNDPAVRNLSPT